MTYTQVWDAMKNQVSDQVIQRDEDGAFIPFDEANIDYVEYLWWLDAGNHPTSCTPPAQAQTAPDSAPSQPPPRPNILGSI
jgi:hypothetical protein